MLQNIQKHKLFVPGEPVILAVSGGADSMALLHGFVAIQPDFPLELHVVTVDHMLRPDSAADAAFVCQRAAKYGVPCSRKTVDTKAIAQQFGGGLEGAARRGRYQALAQVAQQVGARCVVTAHHADDQAETVLMRVLRGSGLHGLGGMAFDAPLPYADAPLRVIRPLLTTSRETIIAYCQQHDLTYRHDTSNDDTAILRNHIRHEVLPFLKDTVNPQLEAALLRLAEMATVHDAYIAQQLDAVVMPHVTYRDGRVLMPRDLFHTWHPALQRRLIHHLLGSYFAQATPTYDHILHAVDVAQSAQVGALAQFSGGVQLRVDYTHLVLEQADNPLDYPAYHYLLPAHFAETIIMASAAISFPVMGWELQVESLPLKGVNCAGLLIPKDAQITLRRRQPGDRVRPPGLNGHSQKLKDWLINRKVPRAIRDQIPLLSINDEIIGVLMDGQWEFMKFSTFLGERACISLIVRKLPDV